MLVNVIAYRGHVPFFLILAGYFLARRVTWRKAFDRILWLLIPFLAWNILYYLYHNFHAQPFENILADMPSIVGFGAVFSKDFTCFGLEACQPEIGVSWFLRDIIVLSLFTPLIVRIRYIALIFVAISCAYEASSQYDVLADCNVLLSPGVCFFYVLGVCLVDFRIEDAHRVLNKKFTPYVVIGVAVAVAACFYASEHGCATVPVTFVGALFGAMMIAQCGVLIEKHLAKLSHRLVPCGPACFLVFMLHEPVIIWCMWLLPEWFKNSWLVWLYPFVVCAAIIAFFLLMKRYTPWLMPYLGHMKVPKKQG